MQSTAFVQYPRMRAHAGELFSVPKPHWLSELHALGARVQVLKVVIPNVGIKLFTPWGRSWGYCVPSWLVAAQKVEFMVRCEIGRAHV